MNERTSERLARALEEAGAPERMSDAAREGYYDDYRSPLTFPKVALMDDLLANGMHDFARRVIAGDFDSTKEESEAWYATKTDYARRWRGVKGA